MRQPGEWIHGKYQVQRLLGAGGMGVVYATQRRNESLAAVKVLHPRFAHDKSIRARFLEEGYLANRVGHPAVVTILEDDIDEEGNFYIVMELLDGIDLGKFVGPPRTPITTAQALNVADQLLAALTQAHQKGIVHRDIKPQNVMILRDGRVKLLDFGIAKALSADGTVSALEDDDEGAVGTDRYMSPEQGNGSFEEVDARSDLWSVGALLMALLADEDPSAIPLWDQSYEDRAWTFSRLGQGVPPHVVQIISLALQPQKTKRWVSAAAMREAVKAAHLDLYGPFTREALAGLAKTQLPSVAEGLKPDELPPIVEPTVLDPTFPSRPSHPPLSPPTTPRVFTPRSVPASVPRLAQESVSDEDVPQVAPPQVAPPTSERKKPELRRVGLGALLFVMGACVAWAVIALGPASSGSPSGRTNANDLGLDRSQQSLPAAPSQTPAALPANTQPAAAEADPPSPVDSVPAGVPSGGHAAQEASKRGNTPAVATPAPSRPRSNGVSSRTPRATPAAGAATTGKTPAEDPAPPAPTSQPKTGPACNGLDGLFNVELCQ